jgi:predicted metal-dependent phosphoesterase TrpH
MEFHKLIFNEHFDLHLHTTASDGTLTPSEIVILAGQKGLKTIAITDHDTTDGLKEAIQTGEKIGLTVIPGIELSTKYKGKSVDILGYFIHEQKELLCTLKKLRNHRINRSQLIINKFRKLGINITLQDVQKYSKGDVIARPHIAKAIVDKGYAKEVQEVFDLYLADGKPCAVEKMNLTPEEGIDLIHKANGIAVLAHPVLIKSEELVEELMELSFDGIEVWHRLHSKEDIKRYKQVAKRYNKVITGGSDYHNEEHQIGVFGFDGY